MEMAVWRETRCNLCFWRDGIWIVSEIERHRDLCLFGVELVAFRFERERERPKIGAQLSSFQVLGQLSLESF